jgi:hypothetical protein
VSANPLHRIEEPAGQQVDIKAKMCGTLVENLFGFSEQVEEKRSEASLLQLARDELVAWAMTAAAAAMGEEHDTCHVGGYVEVGAEANVCGDVDGEGLIRVFQRVRH